MKRIPSSVIYLAVATLLGGYIYFFERKPAPTESEKKGKVLPGFVSDDILSIRLEALGSTVTVDKTPLVLEKDAQGIWSITAPKRYKADESHLRSVLTVAGDLAPDATVKEPGDLAAYGLAPPAHRVTFSSKEGKGFLIEVGSKDIQGTATYVRNGTASEVFLAPSSSLETILKKIEDYRDHTFFKPDPVLAKKVRLTHGADRLVLEKDGSGAWRLTSPLKAKASESKVRELLNAVGSLRITAFEKDDPGSLSTYGLFPPAGSIEVWTDEKGPPNSILVGSKKKGGNDVFAKQGNLPYVVAVPVYFKDSQIKFKVEGFRDKDAMKFDQGSAKSLTLKKGSASLSYTKDGQGQWTLPGQAGAQGEAADLLASLSQTAVMDFASPSEGPKDPSFVAEVSLTDGEPRVFRFGKQVKDKLFLFSDQGSEAYWVPADVLQKLEACFKGPSVPIASPAPSKN